MVKPDGLMLIALSESSQNNLEAVIENKKSPLLTYVM